MRAKNRVRERFELALDARQVTAVLLGSLVILGGVFVLGVTAGRQHAVAAPPPPIAAPKDSLAKLDEPLPVREEPAPELKAHQALTDGRAIDQALPVAPVKPVAAAPADPPPGVPAPPVVAPAAPAAPAAAAPPAPRAVVAKAAPPAPAPKPAARPAPATAAAKASSARYTIQVASSPKRAVAERVARQLAARGPRIVEADVAGKGRYYRVQIGSYDSQEAARRQLAVLSRDGVQGIVTGQR